MLEGTASRLGDLVADRQLAHLRDDARWCVFREVATNVIPGDRRIVVFECECRIALRLVEEFERPPADVPPGPAAQAESEGAPPTSDAVRGTG